MCTKLHQIVKSLVIGGCDGLMKWKFVKNCNLVGFELRTYALSLPLLLEPYMIKDIFQSYIVSFLMSVFFQICTFSDWCLNKMCLAWESC